MSETGSIIVRDLHKSYPTRFGEKKVFSGINFELKMGERLGILGRNGAGKSTLIRLVSGAERPTSGTIKRTMSVSWPLAFGGAFQPALTGVDNVRFITSIYNQDFDRNLAFVEEFAELGPYLKEPVRSYSSGMRARLAFAISMIIEFDCFLIDEIGAVGDARFHDRCNHELFEMRGDRAMIIISHNAGYVRQHCNRWAILHEGRLTHYDDFEFAYENYKELIGAKSKAKPQSVSFTNRERMIESSQHAALADERFRALVQQGDWARDQKQYNRAREYYEEALAFYPYQRTFWGQVGNMHKEQREFAKAEIAYRTAVALGEPLPDIRRHIEVVVSKQAGDYYYSATPVPDNGPAAKQPPGKPDFELLNWLFANSALNSAEDCLSHIRLYATLDSLAAALMESADPRSEANKLSGEDLTNVLRRIGCMFADGLTEASRRALERAGKTPADVIAHLAKHGGFKGWPQTQTALANRYPQIAA